MAVLLFAMATAVMDCYQKDPDPIEDPSGTSEVEAPPSPPSTGRRSLPTPKATPPDTVAWLYIPGVEIWETSAPNSTAARSGAYSARTR